MKAISTLNCIIYMACNNYGYIVHSTQVPHFEIFSTGQKLSLYVDRISRISLLESSKQLGVGEWCTIKEQSNDPTLTFHQLLFPLWRSTFNVCLNLSTLPFQSSLCFQKQGSFPICIVLNLFSQLFSKLLYSRIQIQFNLVFTVSFQQAFEDFAKSCFGNWLRSISFGL
jgi:hypothetical protein